MSFLYLSTYNTNNIRKELDSLEEKHFHLIFRTKLERASVFTSKGSLTLEAALVVPVFFFAMLCLVCLLEVISIQTSMANALCSVGKEISQQAYSSPMISIPGIRQNLIQQFGSEKLDKSLVAGGTMGIDCSETVSDWNTAIINLSVKYRIEIPVLLVHIPAIACEETLRVKGWTGDMRDLSGEGKGEIVFITEYGTVYHSNMSCTYLGVSVRGILAQTIKDARNVAGGKYYACESCGKGSHCGILYVSDYGDRYHTSLNCKKIKRNVYAVPLERVQGMGGCSKCVK